MGRGAGGGGPPSGTMCSRNAAATAGPRVLVKSARPMRTVFEATIWRGVLLGVCVCAYMSAACVLFPC